MGKILFHSIEIFTFENQKQKTMKRTAYFFTILLFSLFSFSVCSQEDKEESKSLIFAIKGKVFDADTKKPIPDASVKLKSSDGSVFEIRTTKKGTYEFDEKAIKGERFVLPNMRYTVVVNAPGYEESQQDEDTAGAEESTTFQLDFSMQKKK